MKTLQVKRIKLSKKNLIIIRNNLRALLFHASLEKIETLEVSSEADTLKKSLLNSPCICRSPLCVSEGGFGIPLQNKLFDLNMVWIPWMEGWYCERCYEERFKKMTLDKFIEIVGEDVNTSEKYLNYLRMKFRDSFDPL